MRFLRISSSLVLALLSLGIQPIYAQLDDTRAASLGLRLDTTELAPYEPLHATITLRNTSSAAVQLPGNVFGNLEFLVAREPEQRMRRAHSSTRGLDGVLPISLAPTAEVTASEVVFLTVDRAGREVFLFADPGHYRIRAQLTLHGDLVKSDMVDLVVRPATPQDAGAATLLTKSKPARVVQGWENSEEGVRLLMEIVSNFDGSALADHARFAIGRFFDDKHRAMRNEDPAAAIKAFEQFSSVSSRVPAMRARALHRQAKLVLDVQEVQRSADVQEVLRQVREQAAIAKTIGIGPAFDELRKKLEVVVNDSRAKDQ